MKLLVKSLKKEIKTLQDNNIKLAAIGCLDDLPKKAHQELLDVIEKTKNNTNMTLTLALSYGSREEIVNVIKELSLKVKNNIISVESIDESIINKHLYTQNLPDVDISVTGNTNFSEQTVIAYSKLRKDEEIQIGGEKIANAVKTLWKSNLFSSIDIYVTNIDGNTADLEIKLIDLPELKDLTIEGVKKGKKEEIQKILLPLQETILQINTRRKDF